MLQALTTKSIEPKALTGAKGKAAAESAEIDVESALEGADFANELSAAEQGALQVKPVQIGPEQMLEAPSKLIQLPGTEAGSTEGINPKVFDPALTQGVEKIVQPKTTAVPQLTNEQVLQIANGEVPVDQEITQAMLKTPQVQTGRAPALDMASSEIDPQLMSMEDFVAQKNLAMKKNLNNAQAYGMNPKAQIQKAGMEHGLNSTQTINELGGSTESSNGSNSGINSQQFILSSQIDMGSNAQVNEATAPAKTFNMSNIKSDNANQIMTQITDYIVQAKAAKEPTVNMRVNHQELGMIDITVNKVAAGTDAIAINIGTHSVDGKNFFQANSKDLFSHLTSTGLNISDLKVETPSQTAKSDFDFGGQSSGRGSAHERQFGSEENQRRHEQERRQDLWNLLKDKEAA
jgi:hypothetical protein